MNGMTKLIEAIRPVVSELSEDFEDADLYAMLQQVPGLLWNQVNG